MNDNKQTNAGLINGLGYLQRRPVIGKCSGVWNQRVWEIGRKRNRFYSIEPESYKIPSILVDVWKQLIFSLFFFFKKKKLLISDQIRRKKWNKIFMNWVPAVGHTEYCSLRHVDALWTVRWSLYDGIRHLFLSPSRFCFSCRKAWNLLNFQFFFLIIVHYDHAFLIWLSNGLFFFTYLV